MTRSLAENLVIPRHIIQVSGLYSSGKTQLMLFCLTWYLLRHPKSRVIFIDTGNAFCIDRIRSFLFESDAFKEVQPSISLHSLLSRIDRIKCFTIQEFQTLISCDPLFQSLIRYEHGLLIIIDSIGALLAPIVGSHHAQVNEILDTLQVHFSEWIAHYNNTIMITNYAIAYGNEIRPALGQRWNSIPSIKWIASIPLEEEIRQRRLTRSYLKRKDDEEEILSYETHQGKLYAAFKRTLTRSTQTPTTIEFYIGGSELFNLI